MTRTEASTSGCWLPLQPSQPRPALLGLGSYRHRSSGGADATGEVLLADCRGDHIDRRLDIHYSLNVILSVL
jgi:hypothetical protein